MPTVRWLPRVLSLMQLVAALNAPAVVGCATASRAWGAQPQWNAYFGNLHAHSAVSDGVETPAVAYAYARDEAQLQFLCLSEHNHLVTAAGMAEVAQAAQAATGPAFVALVGQEFSLLDPGNHVNVCDVSVPIPGSMDNNYRGLYRDWLPQCQAQHPDAIIFCQFNHPESTAKDYGIACAGGFPNYEGDWDQFRTDADRWVRLIAIINGPSDSNTKKSTIPPRDTHRDTNSRMVRSWHTFLERGFHLSPVADQDNHRKSWGTRTTARTGVWIDGPLSKATLLTTLRDGRTFATEDRNLRVWLDVNGAPIGSVLPDPGEGSIRITVRLEDGDEPESRYVVELYRDAVGDGQLPLPVEESSVITSGESWRFDWEHEAGVHECFLVHVNQEDSPDDAWTGPIWISPLAAAGNLDHATGATVADGVLFVGSKNSEVYHYPGCRVVGRIKPENLVEYREAPAGKRLHVGCPHE